LFKFDNQKNFDSALLQLGRGAKDSEAVKPTQQKRSLCLNAATTGTSQCQRTRSDFTLVDGINDLSSIKRWRTNTSQIDLGVGLYSFVMVLYDAEVKHGNGSMTNWDGNSLEQGWAINCAQGPH